MSPKSLYPVGADELLMAFAVSMKRLKMSRSGLAETPLMRDRNEYAKARQTFPQTQSKEQSAYAEVCKILSESVADVPPNRISHGSCEMTDEEAFLDRLSTYNSFNWSCKPKQISPPMCSKFGWRVVEKDLMQCTSCQQFLSAEVPPAWNINTYLEAVRLLEESLRSSHHQFCPWKTSPSRDNYLHHKLLQHEKAVEGFEQRLASLREIDNCLPQLLHNQSDSLGFTGEISQIIAQLTHDLGDDTTYCSVVLALTGWKKVVDPYSKVNVSHQRINCDYCLRVVDLSIYVSDEKDNSSQVQHTDSDDITDKSPKVKKKCEVRSFQPLEQHHSWCPWLQVVAEHCLNSNDEYLIPAWKMLLGIVRTHISQKSLASDKSVIPLRQGVLHVKKIVKDWIAICSSFPEY